jgi:hypothetical protein
MEGLAYLHVYLTHTALKGKSSEDLNFLDPKNESHIQC